MSGGSLDYLYMKIEEAIATIRVRSQRMTHRAFAGHLALVARALQDVEWVLSGDYAQDAADQSITAVLGGADALKAACLKDIQAEIQRLVEEAWKIAAPETERKA
jgi:hypothetical protein